MFRILVLVVGLFAGPHHHRHHLPPELFKAHGGYENVWLCHEAEAALHKGWKLHHPKGAKLDTTCTYEDHA